MKICNNFKNYFIFTTLYLLIIVVNAEVILDYSVNGVLRTDTEKKCNINFINFGIEENIKEIEIEKKRLTNNSFDLIVKNLINANEKINRSTTLSQDELSIYTIVTQNDNPVTFTVTGYTNKRDRFEITIKGLTTCENLTIKQTFKENLLIKTYLLYSNIIPETINTGSKASIYGPSSNGTPYSVLHWDMNKGLDSVRKECGIFIWYQVFLDNGWWRWYVSTEKKNIKNCTNEKFYAAAKNYYEDYNLMEEIFGDRYEGYVIKREKSDAAHMDGIVTNDKYIVENYLKQCGDQNGEQVACTISSDTKLTFNQFTKGIVDNCLRFIIDKNEAPKWTVNGNEIIGTFSKYTVTITNKNDIGSLPKSNNGEITYKEYSGLTNGGYARFTIGLKCDESKGIYTDSSCSCKGKILNK